MVKIPTKLEDLVPPAALGKLLEVLNQPALSGAVKEALNRVGFKDASPVEQVQEAWQQAKDWVGQFTSRFGNAPRSNPQLINATGELLSSDAIGLPMAPSVAEAYASQAIHFHDHQRLEEDCVQAAIKLFECQDALFFASLPAAVMLVRNSFTQTVMSRADAVRVPGFGDVRGMLSTSTRPLLEVGATNGAAADDWAHITLPADSAVILVSPNNLSLDETESQRATAIDFAKSHAAAVIEFLFDGVAACPTADLVLPAVAQRLRSGADLAILPLDGFLGGPNGAIVLGSSCTRLDSARRRPGCRSRRTSAGSIVGTD
jgi:L-seryl-tRNA selenium transferase